LRGEKARLNLRDAQSSCLVQEDDSDQARHVIMPLRL
jgi:DNA polymerase III subunit beta